MITGKKKIKNFSTFGRRFDQQFVSLKASTKKEDLNYIRPDTPENFEI